MADDTELAGLLREIRDQQREALQLQRDYSQLHQSQLTRIERINDRAMQGHAGKALRLILPVTLPLVGLSPVLMSWPYLRHAFA